MATVEALPSEVLPVVVFVVVVVVVVADSSHVAPLYSLVHVHSNSSASSDCTSPQRLVMHIALSLYNIDPLAVSVRSHSCRHVRSQPSS